MKIPLLEVKGAKKQDNANILVFRGFLLTMATIKFKEKNVDIFDLINQI